jgi:hypothetical protein
MENKTEYSGAIIGSNGCSYAKLGRYNQNYFGSSQSAMMSSNFKQDMQKQVVVPSYGGFAYTALSNGARTPSCSGYSNITGAYPAYPNRCGNFSARTCSN